MLSGREREPRLSCSGSRRFLKEFGGSCSTVSTPGCVSPGAQAQPSSILHLPGKVGAKAKCALYHLEDIPIFRK